MADDRIITRAAAQALMDAAVTLLLANASTGAQRQVAWAQASIQTLRALLDGSAQRMAEFNASVGGYRSQGLFAPVRAALPVGIEHHTLAQVQDLLRAHGFQITTDAVAHTQVDTVHQLDHHAGTAIHSHRKHDAARPDGDDGAQQWRHDAIVAQGAA